MAAFLYGFFFALLATITPAKHVEFSINLTWEIGAPDGNPREMVFMNGHFPGPQLDLDYGDSVEFEVINNLPVEATVHFHGIEQQGTPWSDGVPGLSQSPIQPGHRFLYKWNATQFGQYWYHGHAAGLAQDGLYGAILIQPSKDEPAPFSRISNSWSDQTAMAEAEKNAKVVLVSDWVKFTSAEYLQAEKNSNLDIYCVDSILINGKGSVYCPAQSELDSLINPNLAKLLQKANQTISDKGCTPMSQGALTQGNFEGSDPSAVPPGLFSGCAASNGSTEVIEVNQSSGWASLNFIAGMSAKATQVSVDNHKLWIYAVDGNYVEPQLVDTFLMYNGERFSAMVKLDQHPGEYTMRFANNIPDQLVAGYATLRYTDCSCTSPSYPYRSPSACINYGGQTTSPQIVSLDASTLTPFNTTPPSSDVSATHILKMGRYQSNWQWSMNNESTFSLELEDASPILFFDDPLSANRTLPAGVGSASSLALPTLADSWVDIVLYSTLGPSNPAQPPHPIHKHGNKGYLIGSGSGSWIWPSVAEAQKVIPNAFNIQGAPYRDSFTTAAILHDEGWVVFRYHVTDPGAWLLHCHIQTHMSGGMAIQMLDGVDQWPSGKVPEDYRYGNGVAGSGNRNGR